LRYVRGVSLLEESEALMKTRLLKWGNSLAVRIPKTTARNAGFKEGDAVELIPGEEGGLEIRHISRIPKLAELVSPITPQNRHREESLYASVGKEISKW
jgi:antitoxin MazE